jgi:diaminopimelate epimerase
MADVPFFKATACGNDFLIIDASAWSGDIHSFTRSICDRHHGVGADGVEWLLPSQDAELRIKLVNADGSDAEISGNGTRCVAAWYCSQNSGSTVRIETDAGLKTCELISRDGNSFEFRMAMGEPKIDREMAVGLSYDGVKGLPVSMGNPHFVTFVDAFSPQWKEMAAEVAVHRDFPNGTNVEMVRVSNQHEVDVRIWERGVGETLSSGTGSSASAVAAIYSGRAKSPVRVNTPGGTQTVEWDQQVYLTGSASLLCRGEFFS